MAANGIVREALGDLDARLGHWRQTLVDLCRIPSISAAGFPPEEVRRSAQAMAQALRDAGVEHVDVLEIPGVHPYVYGDWLHPPGAPTVLLNQIIEAARARLSLRTVPGMDAREAGRLIVKKLTAKPAYGVKVTAKINGTTPWWTTDPEGPSFEAAPGALKAGFGKETAMVGAGGAIGFVQPFADLLKGAACILMGVADPNTQAHSENESLHLGDWVKAMRSTIHLYDALARLPRG
jgi:acetylornithine deacetylase/succinyl-diaminopimelate desuccinylase-like protein